jgi:hypothetical protein
MKIQPYIDKLEKSKEYKDFHKSNKDAFLTAGFFVLDFENKKNVHQLDFYLPKEHQVAAFTLDHGVVLQKMKLMNEKVPGKLDFKIKTDLDELHGILEDEMKNRSITEEVKKIIAVLQSIDGKTLWNLNCVLSGMEILRAHVDDETQSVLKMEKFSMMDIMKKVPGNALQAMAKGAKEKIGKEDLQKEMKKLEDVKKEIEKQEVEIKKVIEKKEKDESAGKKKK